MIFDSVFESNMDPSIMHAVEEAQNKEPKMTEEEERKAVNEAFNILSEALAPPKFGRDPGVDEISDNIEYKLKAINNPYARETFSQNAKPWEAPVTGFKRLIQNAINIVSKKDKSAAVGQRYGYVLSIQREIVEIYKDINRLFRNDEAVRTYFATNTVKSIVYNGLQTKDKISNEIDKYYIVPNEIPLVDILNNVVNLAKAGRSNEYAQLKQFKSTVYDWLRRYYWFVIDTVPEASTGGSRVMSLADHLYALRDRTNSIYKSLYSVTEYLSQNSQYLLIVQKNYVEAERKIGGDKEAMKVVDEIYTEVLRYAQGMLDFNFTAHEVLHDLMIKSYEEIKQLYDLIKQKTGKLQ